MSTNRKTKGIIFSLDALLGALLLALFASSISAISASPDGGSVGKFLIKQQASDLLIAMDKTGLLSGYDPIRINSTLQSALSEDTGYLLSIEYYNYSDGFMLVNETEYAKGNASSAEKTGTSQRNFVVAKPDRPPLFGVARLTLWKG